MRVILTYEALASKTEKIAVVGLGYVGLPFATVFAEAGFNVIGIDPDADKVGQITAGVSYIPDVPTEQTDRLVKAGKLMATADFSKIAPMNTKNGIARNVKLAALSANQRLNNPFSCWGSMSPCAQPIRKNTVAVPANVNATG